jgi:hypothetical protein
MRICSVRLSKKSIIAGAALGLIIPIAIRVYGALQFGHVRPVLVFLFWPSGFLAGFFSPPVPLLWPAILVNALLFGAIAGILRGRFLLLLAVLLAVGWFLLPPSDTVLTRRFAQHRGVFQHLIEMSKQDSDIVRITANQVETGNGKTYGNSDAAAVLPNEQLSEYRQELGALNMRELTFGREKSGEVFVFSKTLQLGMIRSSYGYLYCPGMWDKPIFFVPCLKGNDSEDSHVYHYQRLGRK